MELEVIAKKPAAFPLDIVLCTYNEAQRIEPVVLYYARSANVVLMDAGSTDATVAIASRAGASVYRRIGDEQPEAHFIHYLNQLTTACGAIFLSTDEYIFQEDLARSVAAVLQLQVICGERIDYLYGVKFPLAHRAMPRGGPVGSLRYDPYQYHAALRLQQDATAQIAIPIAHFHVYDTREIFGKSAQYTWTEIQKLRADPPWRWKFIRRFILRTPAFIVKQFWRRNLLRSTVFLLWMLIEMLQGILLLLEMRYLPSAEQQRAVYAKWFKSP